MLWSWVPYITAVPLLPIWVWTALRGWDARLLWLYPLGALMTVALHLADTLPDIAADTRYGVRGLAHRLGEKRARVAPGWATRSYRPLAQTAGRCWLSIRLYEWTLTESRWIRP